MFSLVVFALIAVAATVWLHRETGRLATHALDRPAAGRGFEDFALALRHRGFGWWLGGAACFVVQYAFLGRIGIDNVGLRVLIIAAMVFLPVARGAESRGWWIFESILLVAVVAGFYQYLVSPGGIGFTNRLFWLLVVVTLGTLCMTVLTRGLARFGFGALTGVGSVLAILAFLGRSTFADGMFWSMAVLAIGSALLLLVSRDIVHMAFWLLSSLAGVAGFYLLLGADFLGFAQVLVYIGGILILFLFGVMLTHRGDVPLKPSASWRAIVPGVVAGASATVLLVFIAAGNNWEETPIAEVATLGPVTELSRYYDPNPNLVADPTTGERRVRPAALPTSFGLGVHFMSTYILPFEVVSILLLVAMVGATYIARGRSEGDREEDFDSGASGPGAARSIGSGEVGGSA